MTTIAQERAALDRVGAPRLRRREQWGSRFDYSDARSVIEPALAQFVHITITNPGNYGSDDAHARAVEAIGRSRFPSTGVSYNRLFMQSGTAYEAQPIGRRGAHTVNDKGLSRCVGVGCPSRGASLPGGNLNYSVRAYAIAQNVGNAVTDAELDSLAKAMAADRLAGFVVRTAPIHGHRCVAWKDCPAARMWARMGELERKVNHYVAVGFGPPPATEELDMATVNDIYEKLNAIHAQTVSNTTIDVAQTHLAQQQDAFLGNLRRELGIQFTAEGNRDAAEAAAVGSLSDRLAAIEQTQKRIEDALAQLPKA